MLRPDGLPRRSQRVPLHDVTDRVKRTSRRFQRPDYRPLEDLPFEERLMAAGLPHLLVPDPPREHSRDPAQGFMVHLGTLERMNIHQIQKELVEIVNDVINAPAKEVEMDRARELLADYTNAIRDYDFMTAKQIESQRNDDDDPFQITTWDVLGYHLINDTGIIPLSTNDHPISLHKPRDKRFQKGYFYNILPGSSRGNLNQRIDLAHFWERITMGLLGGLALISPMLLMVLHKDTLTSLLTVSVSTILFALALAFFTRLEGETVLASVAAYAAVLVVFVGTHT